MKKTILSGSVTAILFSGLAVTSLVAAEFKTEEEKLSYIFGHDIGQTLKSQGVAIDYKSLLKGVETGYEGKESLMSAEDMESTRKAYIAKRTEEAKAKVAEMAQANAAEGAAFLADNSRKKDVKVTDSGLQYQVLVEGKGPKPKAEDTVTVHYRGTTLNGVEFDSSYKRNSPTTFPLNRVIPGWTEGLQLMPVGSKYKFFIPSALAYGETGSPPTIQPNSTLIFEVELLSIGENKE